MAREGRRSGEASRTLREQRRYREAAAGCEPRTMRTLRYSLAESYSWAGTCLLDLGRLDDSEQSFRRALDLLEALHRKGANPRHSEEYADVGALLAGVLANRGEAAKGRGATRGEQFGLRRARAARSVECKLAGAAGCAASACWGELGLALHNRDVDPGGAA